MLHDAFGTFAANTNAQSRTKTSGRKRKRRNHGGAKQPG